MVIEHNLVPILNADEALSPYFLPVEPTSARAIVPMLDWPTDLFTTFKAEFDDGTELCGP
jgi:hypothetical protein